MGLNNEFMQCPSGSSTFVFGTFIAILIWFVGLFNNKTATQITAAVGSIFMLFWLLRMLLHWIAPYPECAAVGYPGQHYMRPFYPSETKEYVAVPK